MSTAPEDFTVGSLYLAGLAQARAPHAGLIVPTSITSGTLVHIRIDRDTSPFWAYQSRKQKISGDVFMTTLLKLHDISDGIITKEQLEEAAASVPVPENDTFGECLPWILQVVQKLNEAGLVKLVDVEALGKEFEAFAESNRVFATSTRFPNVRTSEFCS
ncbi:hypothetical protein EIP86_009834 [Pleurotus ostreatoroseus]|nr:hypothetical protein EIP86_009834 [Pleurotus ostreatoroseus]